MNSTFYYIYAVGAGLLGGDKLIKTTNNLTHAKRWLAKHFDGTTHYSVINTGIVLYSI